MWRRVGRALDGHTPREVSNVVWAQVGRYFADVRSPATAPEPDEQELCSLDGPQAFSGRVQFDRDKVIWCHDLDTRPLPRGYEDSASLERNGKTVIERGAGYLEVWKRAGGGPALALERADRTGTPTARILVVGDLTVAVWSGRRSGGATVRFDDGGWEVESYIGTGAIPWPAITGARAGRPPAGWSKVA